MCIHNKKLLTLLGFLVAAGKDWVPTKITTSNTHKKMSPNKQGKKII